MAETEARHMNVCFVVVALARHCLIYVNQMPATEHFPREIKDFAV